MNVRDLKQVLTTFDDEDLVVMSKDSEGNEFKILFGIEECSYIIENRWAYIIPRKKTEGIPAICLWPID